MHTDVHDTRRSFFRQLGTGDVALAVSGADAGGQTAPAPSSPRTIVGDGFGRVVILRFSRGDKLLEGIRDKLKELGIANAAVVSAIGTLDRIRYYQITTTGPKSVPEHHTLEAPIEFSSLEGVIADGQPHLHITFTDLRRAYAGHLEDDSTVLYVAEVVIAEIKGVAKIRG